MQVFASWQNHNRASGYSRKTIGLYQFFSGQLRLVDTLDIL
jgi:hypothetical protein